MIPPENPQPKEPQPKEPKEPEEPPKPEEPQLEEPQPQHILDDQPKTGMPDAYSFWLAMMITASLVFVAAVIKSFRKVHR